MGRQRTVNGEFVDSRGYVGLADAKDTYNNLFTLFSYMETGVRSFKFQVSDILKNFMNYIHSVYMKKSSKDLKQYIQKKSSWTVDRFIKEDISFIYYILDMLMFTYSNSQNNQTVLLSKYALRKLLALIDQQMMKWGRFGKMYLVLRLLFPPLFNSVIMVKEEDGKYQIINRLRRMLIARYNNLFLTHADPEKQKQYHPYQSNIFNLKKLYQHNKIGQIYYTKVILPSKLQAVLRSFQSKETDEYLINKFQTDPYYKEILTDRRYIKSICVHAVIQLRYNLLKYIIQEYPQDFEVVKESNIMNALFQTFNYEIIHHTKEELEYRSKQRAKILKLLYEKGVYLRSEYDIRFLILDLPFRPNFNSKYFIPFITLLYEMDNKYKNDGGLVTFVRSLGPIFKTKVKEWQKTFKNKFPNPDLTEIDIYESAKKFEMLRQQIQKNRNKSELQSQAQKQQQQQQSIPPNLANQYKNKKILQTLIMNKVLKDDLFEELGEYLGYPRHLLNNPPIRMRNKQENK